MSTETDVLRDRIRTRATTLAAPLGRAWTDDRPWRLLTDLTAIGSRMAGSDGERRAAEVVAAAMREAGVRDVRIDPFELSAWERGGSDLELTVPRETDAGSAPTTRRFETVALPYSPAGAVSGELVDVGYGTPEEIDAVDVAGRIAVASTTTPPGSRFVHRMEKFGYAVEQGAVGFVFVNHLDGQLPPTGSLTFGAEADAVAVGVSKESGAWLREYASNTSGPVATVDLSVSARTRPAESRNVVGRIGPDTDERLLLVAHIDGHDIAEGALDNGCGIATAVTAAGILADAELPIGVDVVGVGAEEIGLLGAERLAETVDLETVKAVINVDGAGRFRNLVALAHDSSAMERVADAVAEAIRQPIETRIEPHPFSDHWPFLRQGVPAVQLHSDSGERGRGWGHTHADTRDKIDDRNVREHAMLTALLVAELADPDREVPRLDPESLISSFREAEFEVGMRAADLWPAGWDG
ncbi:M28 family metallopeptidase [Halorubrum vacuolatum]|uniref:Carboxypeptidase Q n=1 Tax=Halorubrum vacuolatum TaxID=63740 RepID=A0A238VXY9_HALVU|nr:M28 family metallopeptidase [Halorubrum vacuolatum]SNR39156.1 Zn-dependent amino- or carboxypeptidase, M28 family [Halorubrum vacuolatum]